VEQVELVWVSWRLTDVVLSWTCDSLMQVRMKVRRPPGKKGGSFFASFSSLGCRGWGGG